VQPTGGEGSRHIVTEADEVILNQLSMNSTYLSATSYLGKFPHSDRECVARNS
jgi:hypothetical protein